MRVKSVISLVLLCIVSISALSGCQSQKAADAAKLRKEYSCTADVKYNNLNVKTQISRLGDSSYVMNILEPEELSKFSFTLQDGALTAAYGGLKYKVQPSSMPSANIAYALGNVLDAVVKQDLPANAEGGMKVIKGEVANGAFTVKMNADTGMVQQVSLPDINLIADFSNFEFD
jgi:hypothetical protein